MMLAQDRHEHCLKGSRLIIVPLAEAIALQYIDISSGGTIEGKFSILNCFPSVRKCFLLEELVIYWSTSIFAAPRQAVMG